MDKDTIILIVIFSAIVLLGAIGALLMAYKMKLDYKASMNEIDDDEEDINKIIARVIDQEFDKRFEELGILSSSNRGAEWTRRTSYYPPDNDRKSRDKFEKLVKGMTGDTNESTE